MQALIGASSGAGRRVQHIFGLIVGLCFACVAAVAVGLPSLVARPGVVVAIGVAGIVAGVVLGAMSWSRHAAVWLELFCLGLAGLVAGLVAASGGATSPFAAFFFVVSACLTLSPRYASASILTALVALLHVLPLGYSAAEQNDIVQLLFSVPIHGAIAATIYVVHIGREEQGVPRTESAEPTRAVRDGLTGLRTRSALAQYVQLADGAAPYSVVLLGVDRWQVLCSKHGRKSGDDVIRQVAVLLQSRCRSSDIPVRYNDDTFAIIFPGASAEIAMMLGERLREAIEQHRFWTPHSSTRLAVSLTMGVSAYPEDGSTADALVASAQERLETLRGTHHAPLGAVST